MWVLKLMDSEGLSFQSGLTPLAPANVPARCPAVMPANEIVAWTPARMAGAAHDWLMEETQLSTSLVVTTPQRRA